MKRIEINKVFTEKVQEYILRGYIIDTESMRGSQGETAKVDLTKDNELIRVWMNRESRYSFRDEDYNHWHGDMVVIRVSKWKHPADSNRTVWMNELEHIEELTYYQITRYYEHNAYYVDSIEEASSILALQRSRAKQKLSYYHDDDKDITSPKAQEIARRYLISHGHYQRVSMDKIRVIKRSGDTWHFDRYVIKYNGHNYYIHGGCKYECSEAN